MSIKEKQIKNGIKERVNSIYPNLGEMTAFVHLAVKEKKQKKKFIYPERRHK